MGEKILPRYALRVLKPVFVRICITADRTFLTVNGDIRIVQTGFDTVQGILLRKLNTEVIDATLVGTIGNSEIYCRLVQLLFHIIVFNDQGFETQQAAIKCAIFSRSATKICMCIRFIFCSLVCLRAR